MKILFFLSLFVLVSCKAQTYPLNTSAFDIPANGYLKDTNNELNKYVGLWKGNWNGKQVFVELRKVKYHYNGNHPYYEDRILGERKIISSTGQIEIDRITNFDLQRPEIRGMFTSPKIGSTNQQFTFYPRNMCGKSAVLEITNMTTTTMTLHFMYEPSRYDPNCIHNAYVDQHGDFPINFPKDIVLTKQ